MSILSIKRISINERKIIDIEILFIYERKNQNAWVYDKACEKEESCHQHDCFW